MGSFPFLVVGTGVPVMPFLLFWAILRSTGCDGLHSLESIKIGKRSVFLSAPQVSACGSLLSRCGFVPPGWNGGFHLWRLPGESLGRGRAFFDRLILPDSRALGAGLPGLPGSWSLELLSPSRSGCVQLPLPLLFITPFAILVFLCGNFGFEGVNGVFGS